MSKTSKADLFRQSDLDADFSARTESRGPAVAKDDKHQGRHKLRNAARIEITRITAEEQVRKDFNKDELNKLVHSLKTKGQLQPIRVRWDNEQGIYVVLMGERRFRAAQIAGIEELDCIIHEEELTADEIHELQLIENLIRQNLNPIEEANAYQKLKSDRKCTGKVLAAELGVSATSINHSIRLLTLPDDLQKRVASGELPRTVMREVLKLKEEKEQRDLVQRYLEGGLTRDAVAGQVQRKKKGKGANVPIPTAKKSFVAGSIKIQATSKRSLSDAELAETLKLWLKELQKPEKQKTTAA